MEFFIIFWSFILFLLLCLTLPPAISAHSWKRFFLAALFSFTGILFPLFIFWMSAFLVPEGKSSCRNGWLDCFHVGKIALTPLVLWACAAFYKVQILSRMPPASPVDSLSAGDPPGHLAPTGQLHIPPYPDWVDPGLFIGTITAAICLAYGIMIHGAKGGIAWWLLVPLYVTIWYGALWWRIFRGAGKAIARYRLPLVGSIPFWATSILWSYKYYQSLPAHPPSCFVVTAASQGHPWLVRPDIFLQRHGAIRTANQQLATFWQLEAWWSAASPATHQRFRRAYNRFGPMIAARITTPIRADLVYLLLKPAEILAALILNNRKKKP